MFFFTKYVILRLLRRKNTKYNSCIRLLMVNLTLKQTTLRLPVPRMRKLEFKYNSYSTKIEALNPNC